MKSKKLFSSAGLISWRFRRINSRQLMLLLSVVIGLAVGLGAVVIKNSVHFIKYLLTSGFVGENYLYFVYPAIGILATVIFIRFILRQHVGHGIPGVLYSISKTNGIIKSHNTFSSIITSALTVGFGGSVGLEGPTVATGAAIGSNLGRVMRLNYKQITSCLGFACAGAMAAIFKAPITGIVFVLEVIMLDLTMASLVPLLIASVTAALTSYAILGMEVLYTFDHADTFMLSDVPYYVVFGLFAGLFSVYFTRVYMLVVRLFEGMKKWYVRFSVGAVILGILIFLFPSLYGEGYDAINSCLSGDYSYIYENSVFEGYSDSFTITVILILGIALMKVIATSVTFSSGGIGGIFAPTLFMGANAGLLFARLSNHWNIGQVSESNFALVGMAGLIAGVIHAPLTAIFLIAEITGGYGLLMPIMIVATISYGTVRLFETNSVYTIQLAKRGELITHHKDKAVLSLMRIKPLIETNFHTVDLNATLDDLVKVISKSSRNIYPVVDSENRFYGIVVLDNVRDIMFRPELYDTVYVRNLMFMPPYTVDYNDPMEKVAQKFQESEKYNLVVLKDGKYMGFVSRANVFSKYRALLREFSEH